MSDGQSEAYRDEYEWRTRTGAYARPATEESIGKAIELGRVLAGPVAAIVGEIDGDDAARIVKECLLKSGCCEGDCVCQSGKVRQHIERCQRDNELWEAVLYLADRIDGMEKLLDPKGRRLG